MLLSFKTRLEPNNKQRTAFRKAAGTARHADNWGNALIREILKLRETDKSVKVPSAIDLHKHLIAQVKPENPWYYETNKNVPQKALADLRTAWKRCFSKVSAQPRFKKKGVGDSFYLESGTKAKPRIKNDGRRIKLPSIGWVKLSEPLPVTAVHNCVISRTADEWFIAIKYEGCIDTGTLLVPDGGEFHRDSLWSGQTLLSTERSHDEAESKRHSPDLYRDG